MRQPQEFGRYLLLERISVGGMAEVFKAKPINGDSSSKIFAIKRILPSMAEDADFIQMFIDEAKISGQLNHHNIAQIYELGRVDNSHFIAMEFVWGKDLLQIQNRFRRLRQTMKPTMAAFIAARISAGLDHAHRKTDASGKLLGIIHRDVSPQNILVSYEGEVKVIDFGIAKAASRATRTQAGVLKGKFGYMSPEQVRGQPLDRRSDIFAIATILYEMLTAERLFLGESDFATLEKVRNVDVPPPSQASPGCPPELERIILKGLAREVGDRYQWGSELAADLEAFLQQHDPKFANATLAAWMKTQFSLELKREAAVLEEQAKLDPQAYLASLGSGSGVYRPAEPQAPQEAAAEPSAAELLGVTGGEDEETPPGEATQISAPFAFSENGGMEAGVVEVAAAGAPLPLSAESTRILEERAPPGGMASQKTVILDGGGMPAGGMASSPPLSGQSTVLLAAPEIAGPTPRPGVILPTPNPADSTGSMRPASAAPQPLRHPETSFVPVIADRPRKWSLARDVLLGLLVAAVLIGGVLGGRYLLGQRHARGTLVVTVSPPARATVLVDGKERGQTTAQAVAVTIKELEAGEHAVLVRSEQGSFSGKVTVTQGDVNVLNATLQKAPAGPAASPATAGAGVGRLVLTLKSDQASVFIDGAQLDAHTVKEPIPLRAGTTHELLVRQPGFEDYRHRFTVAAGETVTQDVALAPAAVHLSVTSEPPGADVRINGKSVGRTPLELSGLDPAATARVTVSKKGFEPVTRMVSFAEQRRVNVDIKLGGGEQGGGHAEASAKEPASAPSHSVSGSASAPPTKPPGSSTKTSPSTAAAKTPPPAGAGDDGYLIANTQPWARVFIDGKDTGKTTPIAPRSKIPLKPGKHVVTFVANGKNYDFEVVIKPGEDARLIRQLGDAP